MKTELLLSFADEGETIDSDKFAVNHSDFVDESSDILQIGLPREISQPNDTNGFEIDAEMLEIFAVEADILLKNIETSLDTLSKSPEDRDALWEIRRNAHTFKGSAGIVGFKKPSDLAHRIEDLLDYLAENEIGPNEAVFALLLRSTGCLKSLAGENPPQLAAEIAGVYEDFDKIFLGFKTGPEFSAVITAPEVIDAAVPLERAAGESADQPSRNTAQPRSIVRVSLERLDDLVKIVDDFALTRSVFEQRLEEFDQQIGKLHNSTSDTVAINTVKGNLESLFGHQRRLIDKMQEKLMRIRMVAFGALTSRLQRAVCVTCEEERKSAVLTIENPDIEIDNQIVDVLIEPLMHLLRNAVVHGIESSDTRRLLGKPEIGNINIRLVNEETHIVVQVSDDGCGIALSSLKEKAFLTGILTRDAADSMSDEKAFDLMFVTGLTTAERLNLSAGRGVGMSIVKESIETRKGTISVESNPQKGTVFTVRMPLPLP